MRLPIEKSNCSSGLRHQFLLALAYSMCWACLQIGLSHGKEMASRRSYVHLLSCFYAEYPSILSVDFHSIWTNLGYNPPCESLTKQFLRSKNLMN